MSIGKDKLDLLCCHMERWLGGGRGNRSISLLARLSGTSSQTVRRILQKETAPELDTALSILNLVALPKETMEVIGDLPALREFCQKLTNIQAPDESQWDIQQSLNNRERFWCYMLALTVGVTAEKIKNLCGGFGVHEMERMIEENILVESAPGEYRAKLNSDFLVVSHKELYSQANVYITETAKCQSGAQKLFLVYNVTQSDHEKIRSLIYKTYSECEEIARHSDGPIPLAASFVSTNILGENI